MARASTGKIQTDNGLSLFYRRWPGEAGRPVLLFVHGFGEHSGRYRFPVRYFNERGYTIYAYDQRGHGRSGGARGYTERFARFLGDLDRILQLIGDRETGQKIFLVGHSLGGQVVLTYGSRQANRVAGVVTSSANLRLKMPVPWLKKQAGMLLARYVPKLTMPAGLDPSNLSHDLQVVTAYEEDPLVNDRITVRLAAEMFDNQDQMNRIAQQFRLPCLMLHGGDDPVSDPDGTQDFFTACASKDKELKLYPGYYHEIFNEVGREAVFEDIENWLKKRS